VQLAATIGLKSESGRIQTCARRHKPTAPGKGQLAEWLNDLQPLPEFLADESDRTGEFIEMLHGIARVQPNSQYIVEEFECVSTVSA
jgi:hypothetical protein